MIPLLTRDEYVCMYNLLEVSYQTTQCEWIENLIKPRKYLKCSEMKLPVNHIVSVNPTNTDSVNTLQGNDAVMSDSPI